MDNPKSKTPSLHSPSAPPVLRTGQGEAQRGASVQNLKSEADLLKDQLIAWRRDFHRHPELGFQEVRTSGQVAKHLADLGIEVQTGVGKTGVVGVIDGGKPGPAIMLRFDMDGLAITEETGGGE